jgi:hypothetical protein
MPHKRLLCHHSDNRYDLKLIYTRRLILTIRGAANRCWTSAPPRMWGGELRRRRSMQRVRCLSGSSERGEKEKKRVERRPRSWTPRLRNPGFSPRPLSWHAQERSRGGSLSLSFFCSFLLSALFLLGATFILLGQA